MNSNERALYKAIFAHRGQTRKDGVTPYSVHSARSLGLALKYGLNNKEAQAAALSDVAGTFTYKSLEVTFGPKVKALVDAVTRTPGEPRQAYFEQIVQGGAVNVKLATSLDNLQEMLHDAEWDDFDWYGGSRSQTLSYYDQMLEAFSITKCDNNLLDDVDALVSRLHDLP